MEITQQDREEAMACWPAAASHGVSAVETVAMKIAEFRVLTDAVRDFFDTTGGSDCMCSRVGGCVTCNLQKVFEEIEERNQETPS